MTTKNHFFCKTNRIFRPKVFIISILLFMGFGMSACSKKFQKGTLYVGSGGGFVGSWQEYQLNVNGEIFIRQSDIDSISYFKTLNATETRKMFRKYYQLKLDADTLNAPGNIYYYIGKREDKFRNHKVTFGHHEVAEKTTLKKYFDYFMFTINEPKNSN